MVCHILSSHIFLAIISPCTISIWLTQSCGDIWVNWTFSSNHIGIWELGIERVRCFKLETSPNILMHLIPIKWCYPQRQLKLANPTPHCKLLLWFSKILKANTKIVLWPTWSLIIKSKNVLHYDMTFNWLESQLHIKN